MLGAMLFLALATSSAARLLLSPRQEGLGRDGGGNQATCTSLKNRQTHFTVELGVGTPPQSFDVVADTGSDSVIVSSCVCAASGHCSAEDKCFEGKPRSKTFALTPGGYDPRDHAALLESVVITFGSGKIQAVIASDVVKVGKVSAKMDDGLLLMVNQALKFSGPFEGILGLGIPKQKPLKLLQSQQGVHAARDSTGEDAPHHRYHSKGFLQTAGVSRFSMCFNYNQDGVLRLGGGEPKISLGSVGHAHWGLDFHGISIRPSRPASLPAASAFISSGPSSSARTVRASFCDAATMAPGQQTACGAIPDSGTTLMMGPKLHIIELFSHICDAWPRCRQEAQRNSEIPKHKVFQLVLLRCEDWLPEGLDEMPALSFHVAGSNGKRQTLEIGPNGYITMIVKEEVHYMQRNLDGVFPVELVEHTGKTLKVCTPSFGSMQYNTQLNGPVWILGTPLFYEYQVGYDLTSSPPSLSFSGSPCGACEDGEIREAAPDTPAFLTNSRSVGRRSSARRLPREMSGPPRVPGLDTSLPL